MKKNKSKEGLLILLVLIFAAAFIAYQVSYQVGKTYANIEKNASK